MTDGETPAEKETSPPSNPPKSPAGFRFRIIDGRPPFQDLAYLTLPTTPRPGDHINLLVSTGKALFRVDFVNFEPESDFPVLIGCIPVSAPASSQNDGNLRQRMDDVVKWQLQVIERGQTFSNAMIVAGYAGIFGLWTFARPFLSVVGTDVIAILVGVSLFVYISWELYSMIIRANAAHRFAMLLRKQPTEFFQLLGENDKVDQDITAKIAHRWKAVVWVAGILAYGGGLLLLWNAVASLFHLPQWP